MRWLHVIEPGVPAAVLAMAADLIESDVDAAHAVCAVGEASARRAEAVGLRVDARVAGPRVESTRGGMWRSWRAWHGLGGAIESLSAEARTGGAGSWDRVHGWSLEAGLLMGGRAAGAARSVSVLGPAPGRGTAAVRRLVRRAGREGLTLVAHDAAVGASWREAAARWGGDAARVALVEPGVGMRRLERGGREAARLRWGVGDARSVVAVLADPPERVDALLAMLAVGIARETGRAFHMLIDPRAHGLDRAARVVEAAKRGPLMAVTDEAATPWRSLAGCDMALVLGGGVHAAWAMAAGLPVVALAEARTSGAHGEPLLRHDHNALISEPGTAAHLARLLCQLHDDPALRARLGEAAAHTAERYDVSRFAARMRRVCEADSRPVDRGSDEAERADRQAG